MAWTVAQNCSSIVTKRESTRHCYRTKQALGRIHIVSTPQTTLKTRITKNVHCLCLCLCLCLSLTLSLSLSLTLSNSLKLSLTLSSSLRHIPFSLFFRAHMDEPQCMRLPHGTTGWNHSYYTGIPHSAPHTLFNSCKLVRPPRLLCRCRAPHGSHMVQRLQTLCLAHRLHTVPSLHKLRRAPLALSQVTSCQPCSLRPPRNSPLLSSWSVASPQVLSRRPRCLSPPFFWTQPRRLSHTSLSHRTSPPNSRSRSSPSDASIRKIPRGLGSTFDTSRYLPDVLPTHHSATPGRGCAPTVSHLTMPPPNYRSRSSSLGASSLMTL